MQLTSIIVNQISISGTEETPILLECNIKEINEILKQKNSVSLDEKNLSKFRTVDLSDSNINQADDDSFSDQTEKLLFINFKNNSLSSLNCFIFHCLNQLIAIDLSSNKIKRLEPFTFLGNNSNLNSYC
jgi:hypothetical protein